MQDPSKPQPSDSIKIQFDDNELVRELYGAHDENLKIIEEGLGIQIHARGLDVQIFGEKSNAEVAEKILKQLYHLLKKGQYVSTNDVEQAINMLRKNSNGHIGDVISDKIVSSIQGKPISPKNPAQKEYVDAIRKNNLVFGIGPAGTGKTYLAVAMAVSMFLKKKYKRIVLARPAVEAGEKLGFLPGDIQEKVSPYLRPLYDALYDMMDAEQVVRYKENDIIEIAPLAFMRGRTLNNSFVILDEAQNCTAEQMKMCLTRLGTESQMVVTGDITQIDLPFKKNSGLVHAIKVLKGIPDINFTYFSQSDVVRHELVKKIINAYEKHKS